MLDSSHNKFRAAIEVLQKGRDTLVDSMADEIVAQGPDLIEGGFLFNEFLEVQGTRLHFQTLLIGQLELSADARDEAIIAATPPPPPKAPPRKRSRPRPKKLQQEVSAEGSPEDV